MEVKSMSIDDIKPYENNPRDNDDAVDATANSIKQFGWQQPIVVDNDGVIVAGHTRYKAAKKLGLKHVPVVQAVHDDGTPLTDEEIKAYRLADNKTGELADWNFDMLNDELDEIQDIDMADFGFDDSDKEANDEADVDSLDLSDNVEEKFELKVECQDEKSLEDLYDRLQKEGYTCNIL